MHLVQHSQIWPVWFGNPLFSMHAADTAVTQYAGMCLESFFYSLQATDNKNITVSRLHT